MTDILKILIAERDRLNRVLAILQSDTPAQAPEAAPAGATKKVAKKTKGKRERSAESLKRQSEKMKAYWAARRKAENKK